MSSSSVPASPPRYQQAEHRAYASSHTYKDYVRSLGATNPSLLTLYAFLANPKARNYGCQATALDFLRDRPTPIHRQISDLDCLLHEFGTGNAISEKSRYAGSSIQGRILIIEDLTVDVVQLLGSTLDLDPLFLATHLHTVHRTGMRHQTPDDATLPSRLHDSNYVNISYHQPLTSNVAYPAGNKFCMDTAINRKLVFLRATSIGLAQHRVSIIKLQPNSGFWLALVLVDPPLGESYFRSECKDAIEHRVDLELKPYLGTYENFMEIPRFSQFTGQERSGPRDGMLNDLVWYWTEAVPGCFNPDDPSLQSLAYYPLRIVAAEWVKYVAVMQHCIKMYEYEGTQLDLEKFNMDLRELQGWRRRTMISRRKIRAVLRHLQSHRSTNPKHIASLNCVLEDYMLIDSDIEDVGRRLENMLPVVTSLVQIIDARQSFAETANISRLTILALVFVPLSYVSSLFSMNSENMPGSEHFWVYFAVAVPVTFLVFLVARPPTKEGILRAVSSLSDQLRRKRRPKNLEVRNKQVIEAKEMNWGRIRSETMRT